MDGVNTRIVVMDRGWVFVAQPSPEPAPAGTLRYDNARCIRRWGTTKGLGQLKAGPRRDTVIDEPCELVVSEKAVLFEVLCTKNW